jgi:SAM-dependent methyltransferase
MNKLADFLVRYLVSVAANLFLIGFGWIPRFRAALYEAAYALGWRARPVPPPAGPPLDIPSAPVETLVGRDISLHLLELDSANGNVSGFELAVIAGIAKRFGQTAIFEIGTFDGRTALNLAANTPDGCRVYTLDLPPEKLASTDLAIASGDEQFINKAQSGGRFAHSAYATRIEQLWGDSATFDYAPYEGKMDVVFVDGSHSYAYVKKDTDTALRLLKPTGGVILWHDYGSIYWKDLTRALNELHHERAAFASMRHLGGTAVVVWVKQG